ncbi:hypothetical protein Bhyg_15808 [Pseudolycoriella hygida]|uniref:Uncharacterized protein n=1 Tax=Pseudolycoriella hygida TaxID=35572 RepID=A0A9Q0RVH7_9DIPT|nr:hypothetical protein Bhyg_15808 [Pseudolycoriella hygida]
MKIILNAFILSVVLFFDCCVNPCLTAKCTGCVPNFDDGTDDPCTFPTQGDVNPKGCSCMCSRYKHVANPLCKV